MGLNCHLSFFFFFWINLYLKMTQDFTNITLIIYISNLVIRNCSEGFNKKLVVRGLIWFSFSCPVVMSSGYGTEPMALRLKNTGWLQGRLSLLFFGDWLNEYQELLGAMCDKKQAYSSNWLCSRGCKVFFFFF